MAAASPLVLTVTLEPHMEIIAGFTEAVGTLTHIHRIASARPKGRKRYPDAQKLDDIAVLAEVALERFNATAKQLSKDHT